MVFDPSKPFDVVEEPVDSKLTGTVQFDPSKDFEVISDSNRPAKKKEPFGTGIFPESNPLSDSATAFSQGALDTILAGAPEAIAKQSGVNLNDPSSEKFTSPYSYATGQTLGAALPAGGLVGGAKTLLGTIGRSALTGGLFGGASGITEKLKEEENPQASELAKSGIQGGLLGTALGAAIPSIAAIPSGIKGIIGSISPRSSVDLAKQAIRFPSTQKSAGAIKSLNSDIESAIKTVVEKGHKVEDLPSALEAVSKTKKQVYDEFLGALSEGDKEKLMVNPTDDLNSAYDKILSKNPSLADTEQGQRILEGIKQQFDAVSKDLPIEEVNRRVIEANKNYASLYKAADQGQIQPALADAQKVIGDVLRQKMNDSLSKITGSDVKGIRDKFSALMRVEQALAPRITVSERLSPQNLNQQFQLAQAAADLIGTAHNEGLGGASKAAVRIATAKASRKLNDPNYLIKKAFEKAGKNP